MPFPRALRAGATALLAFALASTATAAEPAAMAAAKAASDAAQAAADQAIRDHRPDAEIAHLVECAARSTAIVLDLRYRPMFDELMAAVIANDLARFQAPCDDAMRTAIDAAKLQGVSRQLQFLLPGGRYAGIFLGAIRMASEPGYGAAPQDMLMYQIRPLDGGSKDCLAFLSVANERCSGFLIR